MSVLELCQLFGSQISLKNGFFLSLLGYILINLHSLQEGNLLYLYRYLTVRCIEVLDA